MATILPSKPVEQIEFFEARITPWGASAVAIGTTTVVVTALGVKTAAARAAQAAHVLAQAQAKAATQNFYDAVRTMREAGTDVIQQVKAKAGSVADPNAIYTLALLPVPATPTPVPPPGQPTDFKAALAATGALELKWKCPNPAGATGVIYQVTRRIGGSGAFLPLTSVGTRSLTDSTVPAGTASVTYNIQAVRSTAFGPAAQFTVLLGVAAGGGGEMTARVVEATAPKLAA